MEPEILARQTDLIRRGWGEFLIIQEAITDELREAPFTQHAGNVGVKGYNTGPRSTSSFQTNVLIEQTRVLQAYKLGWKLHMMQNLAGDEVRCECIITLDHDRARVTVPVILAQRLSSKDPAVTDVEKSYPCPWTLMIFDHGSALTPFSHQRLASAVPDTIPIPSLMRRRLIDKIEHIVQGDDYRTLDLDEAILCARTLTIAFIRAHRAELGSP